MKASEQIKLRDTLNQLPLVGSDPRKQAPPIAGGNLFYIPS